MNHHLSWDNDTLPYSMDYGDHFFSSSDGRLECGHVFIDGNQIVDRWKKGCNFTIAELGFGTGLNFLETWRVWQDIRLPGQHLDFISFEASPLESAAIEKAISTWPELGFPVQALLPFWENRHAHPGPWQLDEQTSLQVYQVDAFSGLKNWHGKANAWYLDGFSPAKNPDMWSAELMKEVYLHTENDGTFATYTAAGWVRRNLQDAGFNVKRVPGHGRKRHMSIGVRNNY